MKKIVVISLGGSLIVPDKINVRFLNKFQEIILKNRKKYKFIIVCGGGETARKYINALENKKIGHKKIAQGLMGISSTRLNARFMTYFFNSGSNKNLPKSMVEVKNLLEKHDVVFCGALRYGKHETSDSTSAKLAKYFKAVFVNLTNVDGLYTKNPLMHSDAVFIPKISWVDFFSRVNKISFKPGQHFVLDQTASKIILKNKIPTYILGKKLKSLDNFLNNKKFKGTIIRG